MALKLWTIQRWSFNTANWEFQVRKPRLSSLQTPGDRHDNLFCKIIWSSFSKHLKHNWKAFPTPMKGINSTLHPNLRKSLCTQGNKKGWVLHEHSPQHSPKHSPQRLKLLEGVSPYNMSARHGSYRRSQVPSWLCQDGSSCCGRP